MDFGTAILYVLAVLAIIAVAGLVVYALAGLTVSIIDKKNVNLFGKEQTDHQVTKDEQKLLLEDNDYQLKLDDEKKPEAKKEEVEDDGEPKEVEQTIDFDAADAEKKQIEANRNSINERESIVNATEDEKADEDDDLETMYQKLIADINSEATEEPKAEEPAEEPEEKPEEVEEPVEEKEEVVEEPTPVEETPVEPEPVVPAQDDQKVKDLQSQLDQLKSQLEKEQAEKSAVQSQNEELAKKLEEKPTVETQVVETESLESLTARLDILTQRLTDSEKELKTNKKEYLPLARIKRHLEADKAKLRRKEAIVAKQKVVLFGVNNYVVDPEKEKKLSEDLDILDALRLSVQHCEEVMKDNEDRYPILEKTNGILTKQVEDTKNDISDIQARIAKLQDDGASAK